MEEEQQRIKNLHEFSTQKQGGKKRRNMNNFNKTKKK